MTDTRIRVKRGGVVNLTLKAESEAPEEQRRDAADGSNRSPGVEALDEQTYVFSRVGITLYDLGTRKKEDGTYRHITAGISAPYPDGSSFPDVDALRTNYNNALLEEGWQKALQFPDVAQNLFVDLAFQKDGGGDPEYLVLVGKKETRPYNRNVTDAEENPPPPNEPKTDWARAKLVFKKKGKWSLIAESSLFYRGFDTANSWVTKEPHFEADSVPFWITTQAEYKIYLAPRFYQYRMLNGANSRLLLVQPPILPDFTLPKSTAFAQIKINHSGFPTWTAQVRTPQSFIDALNANASALNPGGEWYVGSTFPEVEPRSAGDSLLGIVTLSAVITKKVGAILETFYVWGSSSSDYFRFVIWLSPA